MPVSVLRSRRTRSGALAALCGGALLSLAGCGAGQMSNMWRDETFQAPAMKSVYVVAPRKDPVKRRLWEDSFVQGLGALGVSARASYLEFRDLAPDTQQVIDVVRRERYDGVLVSIRPPDSVHESLVPGYSRRQPVSQLNPFTGAYYTVWQDVRVPDRVDTTAVANFRTDLWAPIEGGRLVWSGTTNTLDAVDATLIRNQVEKVILPEISRVGILPSKHGK